MFAWRNLHSSGREALPHPAPTSGSDGKRHGITEVSQRLAGRTRVNAWDTCARLCVRCL